MFSKKERLILKNQYKLLMALEPDNREHYENLVKILEHGYTRNYFEVYNDLYDEIPIEVCEEVAKILELHRFLTFSRNDLTASDKAQIPVESIAFIGFDGNDETEHLSYARFILVDSDRYQELQKKDSEYNSHCNTLYKYREMLDKWESLGFKKRLNVDEIQIITN